jgi:hypothetical protein
LQATSYLIIHIYVSGLGNSHQHYYVVSSRAGYFNNSVELWFINGNFLWLRKPMRQTVSNRQMHNRPFTNFLILFSVLLCASVAKLFVFNMRICGNFLFIIHCSLFTVRCCYLRIDYKSKKLCAELLLTSDLAKLILLF